MLLVYIYVALASYNTGYLTLGMGSIEGIIDDAGNVAAVSGGKIRTGERVDRWVEKIEAREGQREWRKLWSHGSDAVMDVPLGGVCEVLYGDGREFYSEDEED